MRLFTWTLCTYTFHHGLEFIVPRYTRIILSIDRNETCLFRNWSTVCSASDVRVINRLETRFNRGAWLEWDYG